MILKELGFRFILIVITLVISLIVLTGWFLNIPILIQFSPELAPMQFNTALCFFLAAASVGLKKISYTKTSRFFILSCMCIAALTVVQYLIGVDLIIDELFMKGYIDVKTSTPGRMSPITSLCFLLFSAYGLINKNKRVSRLNSLLKVSFILPIFYFSFAALIRYSIGEVNPYTWQIYTKMAVLTSFCFFCMSIYTMLNYISQRKPEDRKAIRYSALVSSTIFLVFVLISTNLNRNDRKIADGFFIEEVNSTKKNIRTALGLQVTALERMASRFSKNSYMTQKIFEYDAVEYIKDFKNIQAIEWVNKDHIIDWIVPLKGNEAVLGKNLNKEAKRNKALQLAIRTRKPVFSPIINLIQGGNGLLLFNPIFTANDENNGYLVTVYRLDNLISSLFGQDFEKYNIKIVQGVGDKIKYQKSTLKGAVLSHKVSVQDFGINLNLEFSKNEHKLAASRSYYPELILLLGSLVAFFMGILVSLMLKISNKNRQINKSAQIKTNFLANMSHEIRTPLNGVIGLTELLSESVESQENQRKIHLVKKSAYSLLDLLNDILDFSKLESGHVVLEARNFNVDSLSSDVINLFSRTAERKGVNLFFTSDMGVEKNLCGDEVRIKQILSNLISNAIKFTSSGDVSLNIGRENRSDSGNAYTVFSIKDSGIGISEEYRDKIFDKFTQEDSSTNRKYGGTGLGLSICKSLIEEMNGVIEIESTINVGTTFTVKLPLIKATMDEDLAGDQKPSVMACAKVDADNFKILTAEDNEINQIVIKGMVEKAGFKTDLVADGNEVLGALTSIKYDLILMDCQMPHLDGYETSKKIKELYGDQRPVIVAITASSNDEDIKRCYDSGMDYVVAKPINFKALQERLLLELNSKAGRKAA